MSFTSLRRGPLAELAVSQLRGQVLSGQWAVGERLPAETELARMLGVGRSTIREAVRVLVHAGLLETRQGSGTYVRAVTADPGWEPLLRRAAILEAYEVREALEVQAAGLAAARRTRADIARIRALLTERDRTRAVARNEVFAGADVAFHEAVVAAAHNSLLTEMFASFTSVLREALMGILADPSLTEIDATPAHHELADAIEAGDVAGAHSAMHHNIDPTAAALRSLTGS
jgi:GntR family transcriptional regulator, transcriptional repressor for pyruvate dehydrogenase complex